MPPTPAIPRMAIPLRFTGWRIAAIEQDSPEDVQGCVEAILRYERGDLESDPTFGRPDLLFTPGGPDPDTLAELVRGLEPRADLLVEEDDSAMDRLEARLQIMFSHAEGD